MPVSATPECLQNSANIASIDRQSLSTPVGTLLAVWTSRGLYSCSFDLGCQSNLRLETPAAWELEHALASYFERGHFAWDLKRLDWSGVSDFRQRVLRGCFEIPSGTTLTYGQLAKRVGCPKAARAVGATMAANRWPLLIPCHRVVGSSGSLVGYSGTGGIQTKRWLLEQELRDPTGLL